MDFMPFDSFGTDQITAHSDLDSRSIYASMLTNAKIYERKPPTWTDDIKRAESSQLTKKVESLVIPKSEGYVPMANVIDAVCDDRELLVIGFILFLIIISCIVQMVKHRRIDTIKRNIIIYNNPPLAGPQLAAIPVTQQIQPQVGLGAAADKL